MFGNHTAAGAREVFVGSQKPLVSEVISHRQDQGCRMLACIEFLLSCGTFAAGHGERCFSLPLGPRSVLATKTLIAAGADIFTIRSSETWVWLVGSLRYEYECFEVTETCLISVVGQGSFSGKNTVDEHLEICRFPQDQKCRHQRTKPAPLG